MLIGVCLCVLKWAQTPKMLRYSYIKHVILGITVVPWKQNKGLFRYHMCNSGVTHAIPEFLLFHFYTEQTHTTVSRLFLGWLALFRALFIDHHRRDVELRAVVQHPRVPSLRESV